MPGFPENFTELVRVPWSGVKADDENLGKPPSLPKDEVKVEIYSSRTCQLIRTLLTNCALEGASLNTQGQVTRQAQCYGPEHF